MAKKVARHVVVHHPETGEATWLKPGDTVPDWAEITNDAVFDKEEPAGDFDPDGTVKEIESWVGDDPERAREALAAEQAKGDKARSTLVEHLQDVIEG
jgi:hypothetical protein